MMPEDITCPKETRDLLSECCVGKNNYRKYKNINLLHFELKSVIY